MMTPTLTRRETRALLLPVGALVLALSVLGLAFWSGAHGSLHLAYPAAALVVASLLYAAAPAQYVGFVWWVWFVTPWVRRVLDYEAATFSTASPVMLAPFLVSGLALITLLRYRSHLLHPRYTPFLLVLGGIGFGYAVGLMRNGPWAATFALLEWLTPVLLAFHLLALGHLHADHRRVIRGAFTVGVAALGLYGIVQFFAPPPWDTHWMVASGMTSSIGRPEALHLRVFSTLNAPGPFAMVMTAGLLLLLDGRGTGARLAAAPGYAALLLSLVRGAWSAWLVGVLYAATRMPAGARRRVLGLAGLALVTLLALTTLPPVETRLADRFASFAALEEDSSFRARARLYSHLTGRALSDPVGRGLGSLGRAAKLHGGQVVSLDSGVLALPLTLGWPGTALYLGGLLTLLHRALRRRRYPPHPFAIAAGSIVVAYLWMMLFANQLTGVKGAVLWTFLALALTAQTRPPAPTDEHRSPRSA